MSRPPDSEAWTRYVEATRRVWKAYVVEQAKAEPYGDGGASPDWKTYLRLRGEALRVLNDGEAEARRRYEAEK